MRRAVALTALLSWLGHGRVAVAKSCTPTINCTTEGAKCGTMVDDCGNTLTCTNTCTGTANPYCDTNSNLCCATVPLTCPASYCGSMDDGCGTLIICQPGGSGTGGGCGSGKACINHACVACSSSTCGSHCGYMDDGCGNTLSCSNCAAGQVCSNNSCVTCTKITSCTGKCGQISDGCGGVLDCGTTSCTGTKTECGPDNTCIVPGTAGDSMSQTFAAGALVIPMDDCNNPDNPKVTATYNNGTGCATNPNGTPACYATYSTGNVRHPFGLIYLLAVNNIPVNVILKPDKLSMDDADFTVTPPTTGLGSSPPATATYLSWSTNKYVTGTGFSPSQNPVQYGGMPFVVDATYADQALSVITAFNHAHSSEFSDVPLHIVNYSFTAPVYAQLASRPKPVGISGSPLTTFFTESGITDVVGSNTAYVTISGSGASWSYTWPTALGTNSNTACTTSGNVSTCSSLVGSVTANGVTNANARVLDVIWSADGTMNNWSAMPAFYQQGGNALVVAAASTWEYAAGGALNGGLSVATNGAQKEPFCPADPAPTSAPFSVPGPYENFPASNPFLQIGPMTMFTHGKGGGDGSAYGFSTPTSTSANTATLAGGTRGNYTAIAGHAVVNGIQTPGNIIYLGSLNSWHGNSAGKDGGLHIMYDSLIVGGQGGCSGTGQGGGSGVGGNACAAAQSWQGIELSRQASISASNGDFFLGTYEWELPADTSAGSVLYRPSLSSYPYGFTSSSGLQGHFRRYKAGLPAGSSTLVCDPSSSTTNCYWDAAKLTKSTANRNIYIASCSSTPCTLTKVSTVTGSTGAGNTNPNVKALVAKLDISGASAAPYSTLGGFDYGSAAVVESHDTLLGSAYKRPTVAYVGGRDGMIHAFCVSAGPTDACSTRCFSTASNCTDGYAQGEELWAVIPPGVASEMSTQYTATSPDYSKVDVGGAMRVADISDTYPGDSTSSLRTVLLYGTRELGYVGAIDVTYPDPGQLTGSNASGKKQALQFLWENSGSTLDTTGNSTLTAKPMGATQGVTLLPYGGSSANTAIAVATAANNSTALNGSGMNVYLIRVGNGKITDINTKTYSRLVPTASGITTYIPNDAPPLATAVDVTGAGYSDQTILVSDAEGYLRKMEVQLSSGVYTFTGAGTLFDAGDPSLAVNATGCPSGLTCAACTSGQACQPIGVSPTVGVYFDTSANAFKQAAFVGTGGADWIRSTTRASFIYGVPIGGATVPSSASTPIFKSQGLPTVKLPSTSQGTTTVNMPVRLYAQLLIAGSALFADTTSISVNTMSQLVLPNLYPASASAGTDYGSVLEFVGFDTSGGITSSYANLTAGLGYGGGTRSSIVEQNGSGSSITIVGGRDLLKVTPPTSGTNYQTAANTSTSYRVNLSSSSGAANHPFTVKAWFE